MAITKEAAPHHHHKLVLGLLFMFITRISSQQEIAINSTVSILSSSITIAPSTLVQNYSTNSETSKTISSIRNEPVHNTTTTRVSSSATTPNSTTVTEIPHKSIIVTTDSTSSKTSDCSNYEKLDHDFQPKHSDFAKMKKCCPLNENYQPSGRARDKCDIANVKFEAVVIEAVFFDHCIQDTENVISLDYEIGNPCGDHEALIYSKEYNDNLYVLQNGSLLIVNGINEGLDVFDEYCLDMDRDTNYLTAIVCNQSQSQHMVHVSKAQSYLYAICKYNFVIFVTL